MLGAILVLVGFGCIALLLGFSRWLARRPWAAAGNVAIALALFWLAHAAWPPAMHLRSYEKLPGRSSMVAQMLLERTGQRSYRATLTRLPSGRMQVFEMTGDQWRIEARTLTWLGRAAQAGLPASYRFERLSSRHLKVEAPAAVAQANDPEPAPPSSYALSDPDEPGEDVWSQARTGQAWSDHVEPRRIYGPWRPLANEARYDVWLVPGPREHEVQIEARPANAPATRAMR